MEFFRRLLLRQLKKSRIGKLDGYSETCSRKDDMQGAECESEGSVLTCMTEPSSRKQRCSSSLCKGLLLDSRLLRDISYVLFALAMLLPAGCDKRHGEDGATEQVRFSVDTVCFDTVMHSRVSSFRKVSLRNDGRQSVRLQRVRIEGSRADAFRVAVDGVPCNEFSGALIPGGDSLILILSMYTEEYTPDVFEQLDVRLAADLDDGTILLPIRGWNAGWRALAPLIAHDVVVPRGGIRYVDTLTEVQPAGTLTLEPGATLIFGNGAALRVRGRLVARGTVGARVSFLPQRMEPYYMRKPGQWAGVAVEAESRGVELSHVDVRCAVVALRVQGKPAAGESVSLENCRVLYSSQDGLQLAGGAEAVAVGSIFGQNYRHGVSLNGAKVKLIHCTVCAESMPPQSQLGEGLWLDDGEGSAVADVVNSIIWGDREVELGVQGGGELGGRLEARHSVLKMPKERLRNAQYFKGCTADDPRLEQRAQGLYRLGDGSSARRLGEDLGSATTDLFGTPRPLETPDAGAVAVAEP